MQSQRIEGSPSDRLVQRVPIFYGWIILAVGTLGVILAGASEAHTISLFMDHFIQDLQVSRSLVSTLYAIGTLGGSLALPFVGRQIDRRGPRRMVGVIAALFGLSCICMGFVRNVVMLGLGFLALRMLGHGSLVLVSQHVINQWWVRRRGLVMGISATLVSLLSLGGLPSIVSWLVASQGWRQAYVFLGFALLLAMAPLGLMLIRNRPDEHGLHPDGGAATPLAGGAAAPELIEENWTATEATRTGAFWVSALGLGAISMICSGLTLHVVSIFADSGLSTDTVAAMSLTRGAVAAVVTLASGALLDRIPLRVLLATGLFALALALLTATSLDTLALVHLYGVLRGITSGLLRTVGGVTWAHYFGRRHLGSITGLASRIIVAGAGLGPLPLAMARDLLGSYRSALLVSAAVPLVLGFASLLTKKPAKRGAA